jgi:hypothetical protein
MALQLNSKEKLNDPDASHIYVDLDIVNNDWLGSRGPKTLTFNEIRNNPYILKPNKYFFSVVRFQLDTPTLPVFIPSIEPNQADINKTIYQVAITYGGNEYISNITWETSSFQAKFPTTPVGANQDLNEYYYCSSYQNFLNLINRTLSTIMTSISGKPFVDISPPTFTYDEPTNSIKFHADSRCFINGAFSNPTAGTFSVYVNAPLHRLISGFDWFDYGFPVPNPTSTPLQYRLRVYETFNNLENRKTPPNVITANYDIVMMSEQLDIALWNPVKSLVFSSGLIPVLPTLTSPPKSLDGSFLSSYGNNSNLSSQITDFEVGFSINNTYKNTITYVPSGEYRLIDITSDIPLYSLDISVFWKDAFGNLNPFRLASGCSGNLKLLFRRKDFNNTSYLI